MFWTSRVLCFLCVMLSTACSVYSQCIEKQEPNGTLSHSFYVRSSYQEQCWIIPVPENKFVQLKDFSWSMYSQSCSYAYLRIFMNETNENYTFCGSDSYTKQNPITALSDVKIVFHFTVTNSNNRSPSFRLQYDTKDIECARKSSFHCTTHSCIPKSKVCDGVEDCKNGMDEIGCETGVLSIEGVANARAQAISWLRHNSTPIWGWHENTPRAVTALYLSNGATFNGTYIIEELMVKLSEVKIAIGLLKNPVSNEMLSLFINSLLVTCHEPRQFYGQNLVKRLKDKEESSSSFIHPIVYLTLCNANESWSSNASRNLIKIFNSSSEYDFVKDIQAYAVMAFACYTQNKQIHTKVNTSEMEFYFNNTLNKFKAGQLSDGSFGNVHTTSLVTQALIFSGQDSNRNWNLRATINYLIKELNSTDIDFSAVYLTLPVLNGKSLADIFKVNCTGSPRRRTRGSLKSEIDDYVGPKMKIKYSLFVGDEKDIVHTIILKVPENYTAFQVMRYAEEEDYKYKFEWKMIAGKIYVYRIGKVINDPDVGKFWLLHLGSSNSATYRQQLSSPDKVVLKDGDHFVMWYQTVPI